MRILLVDDSQDFLKAAAAFLNTLGSHQVVGLASSGEAGIQLTADLRPDLVLMDLMMPGLDGLAATRRIKALPAPPQVIILSLHNEPEYQRAASEAAADGFVAKRDLAQALPGLLRALDSEHV